MIELTNADCEEVRAVIDISLDINTLPDKTILLNIFQDTARAWLLYRVPTADVETDCAVTKQLTRALIFKVAALILPTVPNLRHEQQGERQTYSRQPYDIEERVGALSALAEELISGIAVAVNTTELVMFTKASPLRPRWDFAC